MENLLFLKNKNLPEIYLNCLITDSIFISFELFNICILKEYHFIHDFSILRKQEPFPFDGKTETGRGEMSRILSRKVDETHVN